MKHECLPTILGGWRPNRKEPGYFLFAEHRTEPVQS
jgi:hypothetical protein